MKYSVLGKIMAVVGCAFCLTLSNSGFAAVQPANEDTQVKKKVILDTDMVEMFDDGIAMMMLMKNPEIDLLGIVTVTGNTWANDGMAYLVRQLKELKNLDTTATLAIGAQYPNRKAGGFSKDILKHELNTYGDVMAGYIGAATTENPKSWQEAYRNHYNEDAPDVKVRTDGVDYLIEMVHKYPHQITIAAIGPATNIALAVQKDPEFADLVDEIVYMGGAFWVKGNADEAAEFNIWLDPESAKIAYRAPFDNSTFVALDVTDNTIMNRERYQKIRDSIKNQDLLKLFDKAFFVQQFQKNEKQNFSWFVWDIIVSAIIIDPSLVTSTRYAYIDCVTEKGPQYGKTVPYIKDNAPAGTKPASIILSVDQERFWPMLYNLLSTL